MRFSRWGATQIFVALPLPLQEYVDNYDCVSAAEILLHVKNKLLLLQTLLHVKKQIITNATVASARVINSDVVVVVNDIVIPPPPLAGEQGGI